MALAPAQGVVGSSTACLVALHPNKAELLAANVGDSGFIILRRLSTLKDSLGRWGQHGTLDAAGVAAAQLQQRDVERQLRVRRRGGDVRRRRLLPPRARRRAVDVE